ncbi:MAG: hypothetical protein FD145_1036 [Candidatus Saganbacteria bacterium]|uniref:Uncharacterized protein n=1 Tax=Candidatus Saganbacteria bacterium TaxID=2575572 RepID=A0A833L0L2_UNCSA|nr:MAG: hypothetical protein FD145_1036 [Candidatus Saganbacteria bacterium]
MKKALVCLIFLMALVSVGLAAGEGRYQLCQGYYSVLTSGKDGTGMNVGGKEDTKDLFKIDTVTGKVWRYSAHYDDTGDHSVIRHYWTPCQ